MDSSIITELSNALRAAKQCEEDCAYYGNSSPFSRTSEAEAFLRLSMKHMDDLLAVASESALQPSSELQDAFEGLIVAVEFEAPPIADGIDVANRAAILMRCASEARAILRAQIKARANRVSDANLSLLNALAAARQEIADMKAVMSDPFSVHVNMLRGEIAKLSITNCLHIHGATNFDGWYDMTINQIEAKILERDTNP